MKVTGLFSDSMEHVAILAKKRKLLQKIISGEKTIESRWYKSKIAPWGRIHAGEKIYFKESGSPITVKAEVAEVLSFYLPHTNIPELLETYAKDICLNTDPFQKLVDWCSQRTYCVLMRLKNVEKIQPFDINKKGFGLMAAWITVPDVHKIKKP